MLEAFRRQTKLAAMLMSEHLKPGDSAIDATAGKGNDTLLLAQCVESSGIVYAYDIQLPAIIETAALLKKHDCEKQVKLFCTSHGTIGENELIRDDGRIRGAMFNLGYLPGSDGTITTECGESLKGIQAAFDALCVDGLMTICAYRHEAGRLEIQGIEAWCEGLIRGVDVMRIDSINHRDAPILYVIYKR